MILPNSENDANTDMQDLESQGWKRLN